MYSQALRSRVSVPSRSKRASLKGPGDLPRGFGAGEETPEGGSDETGRRGGNEGEKGKPISHFGLEIFRFQLVK